MHRFGIAQEEDRIEIARRVLEQDKWSVASYIKNYDIQDQRVLVDLAKRIAQETGSYISEHIDEFGITREEDRIEIAELAIRDPYGSFSKDEIGRAHV